MLLSRATAGLDVLMITRPKGRMKTAKARFNWLDAEISPRPILVRLNKKGGSV